MSNELDTFNLYKAGQEIGPVRSDQPLAPSPDNWGTTELTPREIDNYHSGSQVQQLFGEALPAGATPQQVTQTLNEIQAVIAGDLMRLGHPQSSINAAISWFQSSAGKTPQREQKRHNFNLHDQAGDLVAESFANAVQRAGGTQKFVSDCLWLMGELAKRIDSQGSHEPPRTATTSKDPLDSLSDADYQWVLRANENAAAQTETTLRRKWGNSYQQNIQMTQEYLNNLPAREREYFDHQYTTGFIHSLNTVEVLEGLFNQAIGANNIPRSGGAVASEIAAIEQLMRTDRKAYQKDLRTQARLRTLYDIRDKR